VNDAVYERPVCAGFNHHVFGDFQISSDEGEAQFGYRGFRVILIYGVSLPLDWGVFAVSIPIIYLRYTYTIMLFFYTLCFIILKYKENKNIDTRRISVYRNPK
jgi:hypothetical protein